MAGQIGQRVLTGPIGLVSVQTSGLTATIVAVKFPGEQDTPYYILYIEKHYSLITLQVDQHCVSIYNRAQASIHDRYMTSPASIQETVQVVIL